MQYKLLDSGDGRKLEQYGDFVVARPDPQAIWPAGLSAEVWKKADASFIKSWKKQGDMPEDWTVEIGGLKFEVSLKNFKHIGVFPEHLDNWKWLQNIIRPKVGELTQTSALKIENSKLKILNLFGYTGGATLALAKAGAEVVHVDASKPAMASAKENARLNELQNAPIRWILDDAKKFVEREVKRGSKYDGVVMDPPVFGRGAKGEIWKIEDHLLPLLLEVKKILKPDSNFVLLNGYASGYTPLAYAELLSSVFNVNLEKIEKGELLIKEQTPRAFSLPAGIFARFSF